MTRAAADIINGEAIAYNADRLLSSINICDTIFIRIYLYTYKGGVKMKVKYTYQTDAARLQLLKIIAIQKNCALNKLLDEIVDAYIKNEQKTFT